MTTFLRLLYMFVFFLFFVFIKKRFFQIKFTVAASKRFIKNAELENNFGYFIERVTRFPVTE